MSTMPLPIIYDIEDRQQFLDLLRQNPGVFIVKFGADWCGPCQLIESMVIDQFHMMPDNVQCAKIDVDESFDIYAYLKSKKIVSSIPALLCYIRGNNTYIPDDVVIGTNNCEILQFFDRCAKKGRDM